MHRIRILYQNYKVIIWKVIGIIVFILIIINLANYMIGKKNKEERENENQDIEKSKNVQYLPSRSVISDKEINEDVLEADLNVINQFIEFCNVGKVEEAYNLLSSDCKEEMFKTQERFYNNYYSRIFNEKKSYSAETWEAKGGFVTYRIKIIPDIMASGKESEEFIEDYYTIIREEKNKKLNINKFIRKEELNKEKEIKGVKFIVNNKKIYEDYERYEISVENSTDEDIVIDTKEDTKTVFLKDGKGNQYNWYGNEIANENLTLKSKKTVKLSIKFNKLYNPKRTDKTINFNNIIIDGENQKLEISI